MTMTIETIKSHTVLRGLYKTIQDPLQDLFWFQTFYHLIYYLISQDIEELMLLKTKTWLWKNKIKNHSAQTLTFSGQKNLEKGRLFFF